MMAIGLDDMRCEQCSKLLFRGSIGLGIIEVKCPRCGHINVLHAFEDLLRRQPNSYVIVFDSAGSIVAASKSTQKHLGYDLDDLRKLSMRDLGVENHELQEITYESTPIEIANKEGSFLGQPRYNSRHTTKDKRVIDVAVRYYPFGIHSAQLTMAIYKLRSPAKNLA